MLPLKTELEGTHTDHWVQTLAPHRTPPKIQILSVKASSKSFLNSGSVGLWGADLILTWGPKAIGMAHITLLCLLLSHYLWFCFRKKTNKKQPQISTIWIAYLAKSHVTRELFIAGQETEILTKTLDYTEQEEENHLIWR